MNRIILLALICFSYSPKTGFHAFFEEQVAVANQAIDLPKWLPMLAIQSEAKENIKLFTAGMKRVKLLNYTSKIKEGQKHFDTFRKEMKMDKYLSLKNKDVDLNIISKETDGYFKEIVIDCDTKEGYFIIGMTGKMKKEDFQKAIKLINSREEEKPKREKEQN